MVLTKATVIEIIEAIPQEEFATLDELLIEIVTIFKIEKGLQDIDGNVLSEEDIDKIIEEW